MGGKVNWNSASPDSGIQNSLSSVMPIPFRTWERIIQRLKAQGRLDVLRCPTQLHDFNTDQATMAAKESE